MTKWAVTYKREHGGTKVLEFYAEDFEQASKRTQVAIDLTNPSREHVEIVKLEALPSE